MFLVLVLVPPLTGGLTPAPGPCLDHNLIALACTILRCCARYGRCSAVQVPCKQLSWVHAQGHPSTGKVFRRSGPCPSHATTEQTQLRNECTLRSAAGAEARGRKRGRITPMRCVQSGKCCHVLARALRHRIFASFCRRHAHEPQPRVDAPRHEPARSAAADRNAQSPDSGSCAARVERSAG
eukprot:365546-Chlamydomonas_euryale.AAC.4